ncbi:aspartate carbamoyltransferase catalytic subunit [Gemmobacter sp.]|uniref:aspartate carbamoyltransferase catalytic subunit n=1 Tax=Gemmobacter sp. TaxID=1898957 RepID=UPI002AFDF5F2|nr:aspartate carbamoyltransferase catalytic subunit [Gemmobacter sp.]
MTDRPNSWAGILDPDEHILWQGQPDTRFKLYWYDLVAAVFGLFFAGFAVVWMVMASFGGGYFWMFGLIHFAVGIGIMAGRPVGSWWMRRHSFYSLSNKRAFIASDYPFKGRVLRYWEIRHDSPVEFIDGDPQVVNFATEIRDGAKGRTTTRPVGFEGIHDGRKVIGLMRAIQRGAE